MGDAVGRGRGLPHGVPDLSRAACVPAAEEYLSFAFEHCHRSSQKNKRMILIYLLPVKMLLVSTPTAPAGPLLRTRRQAACGYRGLSPT